jgi:hypothetical protein
MVAHGVCRGTDGQNPQAPEGRQKTLEPATALSPLPGLGISANPPTAHAVGYLLSLLRS